MGSSEIIYKALHLRADRDVPGVHGHAAVGDRRTDKEPASAQAAYREAKAFVEKHGLTLLNYTPFYDSDALATLPSYAAKHH